MVKTTREHMKLYLNEINTAPDIGFSILEVYHLFVKKEAKVYNLMN
jgi:hypothetical protein